MEFYEESNSKIIVTYSYVNYINHVTYGYYYEFDEDNYYYENDKNEILLKVITNLGKFENEKNQGENLLLVQLKGHYLRVIFYNKKTKKSCCNQLGHCVCSDYSHYIRFSDSLIRALL